MVRYHNNLVTVACAVAAEYLEKSSAEALFQILVKDYLKGKRTDLGWCHHLETVNRSLDEAIIRMDEEEKGAATTDKRSPGRSAWQGLGPRIQVEP